MASSPLRSKFHFHARSISLPSTSHPLIPQINQQLCKLSDSEATSSSISNRLTCLENLFDCVDDFLHMSHTQQVFGQQCQKKLVDEVLDGFLRLLDLCSTSKDVISQTKQDVQQLLSIIRRRRDTTSGCFGGYLASRKKATKLIKKSLKDLKSIKNKNTLIIASENDNESVTTFKVLNEVALVTLTVFESLMSSITGTKAQSMPSGWSLVSKLVHHPKIIACQDAAESDRNEFEKVDATLYALTGHKTNKSEINGLLENLQSELGMLDLSIQDFEERLECLFRRLIKTRVSLLNIIN